MISPSLPSWTERLKIKGGERDIDDIIMDLPTKREYFALLSQYDPSVKEKPVQEIIEKIRNPESIEDEEERLLWKRSFIPIVNMAMEQGTKYVGAPVSLDGQVVGVLCAWLSSSSTTSAEAEHEAEVTINNEKREAPPDKMAQKRLTEAAAEIAAVYAARIPEGSLK
jgi:predicted CopG family antitoxin